MATKAGRQAAVALDQPRVEGRSEQVQLAKALVSTMIFLVVFVCGARHMALRSGSLAQLELSRKIIYPPAAGQLPLIYGIEEV